MTFRLEQCPQPSTLSDYLLGLLPPDQSESCEMHLSHCPPCVETIQGLEVTDTLHDLAANAAPLEMESAVNGQKAGDSSVLGNLIHRMQNLRDGSNHQSMPRVSSLTEDRAAEILRLLESPGPGSRSTDLGTLDGYRIEKILGAGSSSVVFQAIDESLGRTVALKILRPSLGAAARERFITEARATAKIDHLNVIAIYQVGVGGESDSLAYIAMQLLPGETLGERLARSQVLSVPEATHVGKQVADGLAAAHAQGLIHRDIKPANLWIVDETSQVKILDFGLVRITDENPQLTCTGMIAGTPCFMSPEQSRGADLDERSDLFSLGCVMYQSLTGKLPFESANELATLQSIQRDQPTPPADFDDNIPTDVSDLTMALLEKSSLRRPKSAADVSDALESNRKDWKFEAQRCSTTAKSRAMPPIKQTRVAHHNTGPGMSWSSLIATLMILGGFCWAAFLFGPQIIRIATDQGVIVIDSNDPDVKVEILQEEHLIRVVDLRTQQSIDLKAGSYEIKPIGDGNSIDVENGNVVLKRGEKSIVKITKHEPDTGSAPIAKGELPANANSSVKKVSFGALQSKVFRERAAVERLGKTDSGAALKRLIALQNDLLNQFGDNSDSQVVALAQLVAEDIAKIAPVAGDSEKNDPLLMTIEPTKPVAAFSPTDASSEQLVAQIEHVQSQVERGFQSVENLKTLEHTLKLLEYRMFKTVLKEIENGTSSRHGTIYALWASNGDRNTLSELKKHETEIVSATLEAAKSNIAWKSKFAYGILNRLLGKWGLSKDTARLVSAILIENAAASDSSSWRYEVATTLIRTSPETEGLIEFLIDSIDKEREKATNAGYGKYLIWLLEELDFEKRKAAVPAVAMLFESDASKLRSESSDVPQRYVAALKFLKNTKHNSALPILERIRTSHSSTQKEINTLCNAIRTDRNDESSDE